MSLNLESLEDFMLTGKKLSESLVIDQDISVKESFKKADKNNFFYPKQKDSLFWCFYIMKNGQEAYDMLEYINVIIEKKIKIEYVELLRKNKQVIKSSKIAPLVHIENYLVNEPKIDIKTFLALCIIEKIELVYLNKNTYFLLAEEDEISGELHVLKQLNNPIKYGVVANEKVEKVKEYTDKFYKVDNIAKPIKAPSAYKVGELVDIANKLGIDILNKETNKQKTKNEIYELVVQYF